MHFIYATNMAFVSTSSFATTELSRKFFQELIFYCVPDGSTRYKETKVIVKYLEDHPEQLNQPAYLTKKILMSGWCKTEQRGIFHKQASRDQSRLVFFSTSHLFAAFTELC